MSADLATEFLAHYFEESTFEPRHVDDIGDKCRIQLDRQPRRQIDSEMIVRKQQNAFARQNLH